MTYDKNINFYNCNPLLAQPQQMTVGDVQVLKLFLLFFYHNFFFLTLKSGVIELFKKKAFNLVLCGGF